MDSNPLHLFCGIESGILARVFTELQYRHTDVLACHTLTELERCTEAQQPTLLALSAGFALQVEEGLNDLIAKAQPELLLICGSETQRRQLLTNSNDLPFLFLPEDYDVPGVLLLLDAYLESRASIPAPEPTPTGDHELTLRQLHKLLSIGTWEVNLKSGLGTWSPEVYEMFDLPPGRGDIGFETFISRVHPDERNALMEAREHAISGESPLDIQYRIVSGGSTRWVREYGELIDGAQEKPERFTGVLIDVSQSRALSEQLHRASQLEALGQLVAGVAHNFNNLLTVIMGNSEDLAGKLQAYPELTRQLDLIIDSSRRGAQLIRELMVYSRQRQLNAEGVEINQLIQRLKTLLEHTLGRGIRLQVHSEVDSAPARVDPAKLENSVIGLVLNAREALGGQGEITIQVEKVEPARARRHFPGASEDDFVAISIADNGPGMPADILAHATELFFTTKSPGQSSGLGLAEIKGFLEQSHGHLHLQSEVGRGTRVTMLLPCSEHITIGLAPYKESNGKDNRRVVIVAIDDLVLRRGTADCLAGSGYRVIEAGDAAEAQSALLDYPAAAFLIWKFEQSWGELGNNVIQAALQANQKLRVLLTSLEDDTLATESGRYKLVPAPLSAETLASSIEDLVLEFGE
ncbi:MAG: ATP-binding protein [Pseudohongiellaceae bacterium]